MGKHRSRLRILANILSVVGANKDTKKTQIMYQAYLSYKLLVQYLSDVINAGLLISENGTTYQLTSKGELFLVRFDKYIKSCENVDKHLNHVKDQQLMLQEMCPNREEVNIATKTLEKKVNCYLLFVIREK